LAQIFGGIDHIPRQRDQLTIGQPLATVEKHGLGVDRIAADQALTFLVAILVIFALLLVSIHDPRTPARRYLLPAHDQAVAAPLHDGRVADAQLVVVLLAHIAV